MVLLILSLFYAGCIEIPRFIRKRAWKEGAVFMLVLVPGLTLGTLLLFGMQHFSIGTDILELVKKLFPFVNTLGRAV